MGALMKKLYISCPMRDRKPEDIVSTRMKMKKIAEAYTGETFEIIPIEITEKAPQTRSERIWSLGQSIQKMAKADFFVGLETFLGSEYKGCAIERRIALEYDIPMLIVDKLEYTAPDIYEKRKSKWGYEET